MNARLELANYRRVVASNYLSIAELPAPQACSQWRSARDELFWTHPQSALTPSQKAEAVALAYFPYDPAFRVPATLAPAPDAELIPLTTDGVDGVVQCEPVGVLEFELPTGPGALTLFWIRGYGGGLFLPFRDGSAETYGGGRYLVDTLKGTYGAGLVTEPGGSITLDFNFAYNPSCVYNSAYACPLAPRSNWLAATIAAGEKTYPNPAY